MREKVREEIVAQVKSFLHTPLPKDWESMSLAKRRAFWAGDRLSGELARKRICALEIWEELFAIDRSQYTKAQAREINTAIRQEPYWRQSTSLDCGPLYGRQRGFEFDPLAEALDKLDKEG